MTGMKSSSSTTRRPKLCGGGRKERGIEGRCEKGGGGKEGEEAVEGIIEIKVDAINGRTIKKRKIRKNKRDRIKKGKR